MYRLFRIQKIDEEMKFLNIYKPRILPYYHNRFLDNNGSNLDEIPHEDPDQAFKFDQLTKSYSKTLDWVKQI